jgi:HEAT repeat protein
MKRRPFTLFTMLALAFSLGLVGCSRTIDDIAKWQAKGDTEKLIKALADPKTEVRQAAATALGELKAVPAIDSLAALFNDAEESVVLASVNALAAIGTESTISPMIAALKLDYPRARNTATVSLGELKAVAAVEPLCEVLDDSDETIQCNAAIALGQIGQDAASEALVNKLSSRSERLRLECTKSLALTGGKVAANGLTGALADSSGTVQKAAIASLIALGKISEPYALEALKGEEKATRKGAIAVIKGIKAIPLVGTNAIWYNLAKVSVDNSDAIDTATVTKLAKMRGETGTLVEACAHEVADFREHAFRALETIGAPGAATAIEAADNGISGNAATWYKARQQWEGSPSWHIDMWAALTALNPDFEIDSAKLSALYRKGRPAFTTIVSPDFTPAREYIPALIALLGDETVPPPEQADYDAEGMPIIKKAIDRFRGEANQQMAQTKLIAAGELATYPLLAAIESKNELVAGHAADILGSQGEKRALEPMMLVLGRKIDAGEELSNSPFYNALQKLNDPAAEPLLLKVRPNPDRAMHVFERKYGGARAISAETKDATGIASQPIGFRLGYIDNGKVGEMEITFVKDGSGDWKPTPALPDSL